MATTELAEALPVESVRLALGHGQEHGLSTAADLRRALWTADIATTALGLDRLARLAAKIAALDGGLGSFLLWNAARQYPAHDPAGTIVGVAAVKIRAVAGDRSGFSLKGLPAAYVLAAGDMVLFKGYAASIVRFWVFRLNGKPLTTPSLYDLPSLGFDQPWNLAISASVAASALTISITGIDGNAPSSTNPVTIPFRSATATSGTPVWRSLTSALSLVISSGSTMGTANSTPFRLWLVLFDDAGTVRLGAINCLSGTNIYPLAANGLASSTAEGGAGAADIAQVIYTGTAVSSKAFRVIGFMDWGSGLATAGTWASAPTLVQLFGPGVALPGQVVQHVRSQTGAVATGTTALPYDDTPPQITEGDQYMSQAITPTSACNVLAIEAVGMLAHSSTGTGIGMALFQDAVASALAGVFSAAPTAAYSICLKLQHWMLSATSSSTTMRIRAGGGAGATTTFNGTAGGRIFGNVAASYLDIREIMA